MASKRTCVPFYGKAEQRFEKELSLVLQRMRAAGANAGDISEMIQYGTARLDNMRAARASSFLAKPGHKRGGLQTAKLAKHLASNATLIEG